MVDEKVKKYTTVSAIVEVGSAKNRDEMAGKVLTLLTKKGITKNKKGVDITIEKVKSMLSAVIRDIKAKKKGWWNTYMVEETDTLIKLSKV